MLEQDSQKFAKLIVGIGEVYGKPFSSVAIEIYWRVLEAYRLEDVSAAIYRHIENPDVGKFLPKPADIIMAIEGNSQNQALSAWSKVIYAMRIIGGYESVVFDDALIHVVVRYMCSWSKLCDVDDRQLPFTAKEFQERYRGYVIKKPSSHPPYLKGRIELQNSAFDYTYAPPILIGNVIKAKQVMATGEQTPFLELYTEKIGSFINTPRLELNKIMKQQNNETNKKINEIKHVEKENGNNNK